ncbi:hypothetical protein IGJ47_000336 [Enterococcus sp. AZ172]
MKLIRLATIAVLSTTALAGGASTVFADEVQKVTTPKVRSNFAPLVKRMGT